MKTTSQTRLARLAGFTLLSMLVFAIGVQAALAAVVTGSGAGSGAATFTPATPAQLQGLTAANAALHDQGSFASVASATAPAGTQGRGGVAVAALSPSQPQGTAAVQRHYGGRFQPSADVLAAQAASTGGTSRSAWIAAGSAAAIVLVGFAAWALMRRRRQPGDRASAAYCAQHPDDAMCAVA